MNKKRFSPRVALAIAVALSIPGLVLAEESEKETPQEEQDVAARYAEMPASAKAFLSYLQDLDSRYGDAGDVDPAKLYEAEGEKVALLYCAAVGVDGPCSPATDKAGNDVFVAYDAAALNRTAAKGSDWWAWLSNHLFNVGVIPQVASCPAGTTLATIHHDDEDRRNANNRGGWLGATSSTANTTWRFCKLNAVQSIEFRPLPKVGDEHDYSVLNMGLLCPSGSRRLVRVEEGELWRNANSSSGGVFPNFRVYNTWFNFYCHFDGGAKATLGYMNEFPKLGFSYGVYAARDMPSSLALSKGFVFQDDEDWWNWNAWWFGSGDQVMWDGRNTWRMLAKVR